MIVFKKFYFTYGYDGYSLQVHITQNINSGYNIKLAQFNGSLIKFEVPCIEVEMSFYAHSEKQYTSVGFNIGEAKIEACSNGINYYKNNKEGWHQFYSMVDNLQVVDLIEKIKFNLGSNIPNV